MMRHRDWPGMVEWFEKVSNDLPSGAMVYTDQPGFAAPLRFIWHHRAYELHWADEQKRAALREWLESHAGGNPVYLFTGSEGWVGSRWEPVGLHSMSSSMRSHRPTGLPTTQRSRSGRFTLYRLADQNEQPDRGY